MIKNKITTKICSGPCNKEKNIENFPTYPYYLIDGTKIINFRGQCKKCYNEIKNKQSKERRQKNKKIKPTTKICKLCKAEKQLKEMQIHTIYKSGKISYRSYCLICYPIYTKKYKQEYYADPINIQNKTENDKIYYQENKEEIISNTRKYYKENKNEILKKNIARRNIRRHEDLIFKLREMVSGMVIRMLKSQGGNKNNKSCIEYFEFTAIELKNHLMNHSEKEWWMTKDNYGVYKLKDWDNTDPATWKWNIDHIIPQSDLPYSDMNDENFKKTWALSNLRPYSAKQNSIDGATRIRHKKK